ncbi:MAG: tetratricopeptide repeat protein [Planctomycetota bacterium]
MPDDTRSILRPMLCIVVLAVVTAMVASSGRDGGFLLDDIKHVLNNDSIRDLGDLGAIWSGTRRPLVNLTLAMDYARNALEPTGYHVTNIIIHTCAAIICFVLIRQSLRFVRFDARRTDVVACVTALVWAVHPLQTQSVTYIIQRGEALMGVFYLLAMLAFALSVRSKLTWIWWLLCALAIAAGVLSKAVIVTVPVAMFVYDRCIVGATVRESLRRRAPVYVGAVIALLLLIPLGVATGVLNPNHSGPATVGFAYKDVSPFTYLVTQSQVILHYLRLSVIPTPLIIDYGWFPATLASAWWSMLLVGLMVLGTCWLVVRRSPWGMVAAWFFIVLAPTSSFIPIRDIAFEHRMYLPLLSVCVLIVVGGDIVLRRCADRMKMPANGRISLATALVLIMVATLVAMTVDRNADYESPQALWASVVERNPDHVRAWVALGNASVLEDDPLTARSAFQHATTIPPDRARLEPDAPTYLNAWIGLATVLDGTGDVNGAIIAYQEEVRRDPNRIRSHARLGFLLEQIGDGALAIQHLKAASVGNPDDADSRMRLARLYEARGRDDEAYAMYTEVILLAPRAAEAFGRMAAIDIRKGRFSQAEQLLLEANRRTPGIVELEFTLGVLYDSAGMVDAAAEAYRRALAIDPNYARASDRLRALEGALPAGSDGP